MKKTIAILCLSIFLSGCVTTAILSSATLGGSILYDKRSLSTMIADRHITQTAENLVSASPELTGRSNISIATFNHVTLLVGQAQTPALKERAYKLVSAVPDISRLYNEITISGATSTLQATNDTWLTGKVKMALLTKLSLNSTQLKIITENSRVYLMGEVTHQQANAITNVARRVPGVTKVVKVFQYTQ